MFYLDERTTTINRFVARDPLILSNTPKSKDFEIMKRIMEEESKSRQLQYKIY